MADGGAANMTIFYRDAPCQTSVNKTCTNRGVVPNTPELMTLRNTDGGTYYVVVDSYTPGPVKVTFSSLPPANGPVNEICSLTSALPIAPGVAANGTLNGASDDYSRDSADGGYFSGCIGGAAPDVFYRIVTDGGTQLNATVTPTGTASTLVPGVLILSSCFATSGMKSCNSAATAGTAATTTTPITAGATYYIAVEGKGGTRGDFRLDVTQQ